MSDALPLTPMDKIRELSAKLDAAIANYDDDQEFDPELVALAERAIQSIEARAAALSGVPPL